MSAMIVGPIEKLRRNHEGVLQHDQVRADPRRRVHRDLGVRCRRLPRWPMRSALPGVARRSKSRGSVGEDRRMPRGLPLLLAVLSVRQPRSQGNAVPRFRRDPRRRLEELQKPGVSEFCIVLAVRGPSPIIMAIQLAAHPLPPGAREQTGLNVAVSAGILTPAQAGQLAAAGVHRYNHNIETARSFFGEIVTDPLPGTSEPWTCRLPCTDHGMELCCGVLLGDGRSPDSATPGAHRPSSARARTGGGADQFPGIPAWHRPLPLGDRPSGGATRSHPLDRLIPPRPCRESSFATPAGAR